MVHFLLSRAGLIPPLLRLCGVGNPSVAQARPAGARAEYAICSVHLISRSSVWSSYYIRPLFEPGPLVKGNALIAVSRLAGSSGPSYDPDPAARDALTDTKSDHPMELPLVGRCKLKPVFEAPAFSARNYNTMKCFQVLLSISTCARTRRRSTARR